jgi:hypothetical protein
VRQTQLSYRRTPGPITTGNGFAERLDRRA